MNFSPRLDAAGAAPAFTLRADDLIEIDGCLFHPVDQSGQGVFLISADGLACRTVPWGQFARLYFDANLRIHADGTVSCRGTRTEPSEGALDTVPGDDDRTSRRQPPHAAASHGRLEPGRSFRSRKGSRPGNAEPLLSRAALKGVADPSSGFAGQTGHRRYRQSRLYVESVLARHGRRRSIWGRPRLR